MPPKKRLLRTYLLVVIFFAILEIADLVFTLSSVPNNVYVSAISLLNILFFLGNGGVLIIFLQQRWPGIVLAMPAYQIGTYFLFYGGNYLLALFNILWPKMWIALFTLSLLSSLFTFGFAVFLWRRQQLPL